MSEKNNLSMSKMGTENKRTLKIKDKELKDRGREKEEEKQKEQEIKKEDESEIFIDESGSYHYYC